MKLAHAITCFVAVFGECLLARADTASPDVGQRSPVYESARTWWAFQPVTKPDVSGSAGRNPIDVFLDKKMEEVGLRHAPQASRSALIRRVTFNLLGVPPTMAEQEAFLNDSSPEAWARVVDRLLASPAYGERWARHWLDVVRYADYHDADAKARTASCEPLEAWRYRDWVVDSFNADLPYDRFIQHQIAGDLLKSPTQDPVYVEGLVASGFLVNGVWDRGDADKEKLVSDMVDDQIDTIGKVFLGLTLGCARCHDHKTDPISNQDYYALAGMFYSTHIMQELGTKGGEITLKRVPLVHRSVVAQRDGMALHLEKVKAKLAALDNLTPKLAKDHPERKRLEQERDTLQSELPPLYPVALCAQEGGMPGGLFPNVQDVPIHVRGSYARLGPVVGRRLPAFFASQAPITNGSGRLELASWISTSTNPLTARVMVNRVWQWHFGQGLVITPNNFGLNSGSPSHPELLDWLAAQFVEDGWSLKKLHRRILLSAAYQRATHVPGSGQDPENRWLTQFLPRRLEAEALRDAMLFVSGELDFTRGGPAGADLGALRRSLYVQTARWDRSSFAMLFDAPNPDASVEKRTISTVAPQALFLLNHPFVHARAKRLADGVLRENSTDSSRIDAIYRTIFGRAPKPEEARIAAHLIATSGGSTENERWHDLSHTLLCSNEFTYVD